MDGGRWSIPEREAGRWCFTSISTSSGGGHSVGHPVELEAVVKKETRASERYSVRLAVTVTVGDRRFEAETGNISLGGAYIATSEKVALAARLKVWVKLP